MKFQDRDCHPVVMFPLEIFVNSTVFFFQIRIVWGGVQLGPLGKSATNWPIVPAPGDYEDGEFGAVIIGRGNRSTRRKPVPMPLYPPQIPRDLTWARTAVGNQQLTA
jgi:hypothetical protein